MYKILLGCPAMGVPENVTLNEHGLIEDYQGEEDEDIWLDFGLVYNCDENYFFIEFETMIGFEDEGGARNWINTCLANLTEYMNKHGYDTSKELNMYQVFTGGVNANSRFESIEEAYAFMKFAVNGFRGNGLLDDCMSRRVNPVNNEWKEILT